MNYMNHIENYINRSKVNIQRYNVIPGYDDADYAIVREVKDDNGIYVRFDDIIKYIDYKGKLNEDKRSHRNVKKNGSK